MKKLLFINCVLLILAPGFSQTQKNKEPVHLIFDTDIGPDYDDVGAMAILHAMADRGEVEILGVMASNRHPLVAPVINVINTWYGRPGIPIGAPKGKAVNLGSSQKWADSLVAHYPHQIQSTESVEDAVTLYRKILSARPDHSVVVVTVGFLTNLANLLRSPADAYSSLNGRELVQKKVKLWVAMAGWFPSGKEFNVHMDAASSVYAVENWPTPVILSGFEIGASILTGPQLIKVASPHNPVAEVFRISMPMSEEDHQGRKSWDQTAALVGVRGVSPYFNTERGNFKVHPDGSDDWTIDPKGKHLRLVFNWSPSQVREEIENLMCHEPGKK